MSRRKVDYASTIITLKEKIRLYERRYEYQLKATLEKCFGQLIRMNGTTIYLSSHEINAFEHSRLGCEKTKLVKQIELMMPEIKR